MNKRHKKTQRNREIWKKSNGVCAHCGNKLYGGTNQTIDHFIPRSKGGGFDSRNLMPLCKKCNKMRGSTLINPWDYYIYADELAIQDCIQYYKEIKEILKDLHIDIKREIE